MNVCRLIAIAALALGACANAAPPDAVVGERVGSVKASVETTRETGVVSWDIYRDATHSTVIGVDGSGHRAFLEEITESVVDGKRELTIAISEPAMRSYRVREDGSLVDIVKSTDTRIAPLIAHLSSDTEQPGDDALVPGPCISCLTNSTACVAAGGTCVATCPTTGIGCLACVGAVGACFAAGYYCACCYDGGTNC